MANILMATHNRIPDARLEKQARSLRKAGHNVFLITPEVKAKIAAEAFNEVFIFSHTKKHLSFIDSAIKEAAKFYERIILDKNITILHMHNIYTAYIGSKIKEKLKLKVVYDDHETWSIWLKLRAKATQGYKRILRFYLYLKAKRIEKILAKKSEVIVVTNVKCIPFYEKLKVPTRRIVAIENVSLQSEIDEALKREDLVIDYFKNERRKTMVHTYSLANTDNIRKKQKDKQLDREFGVFVQAQEILDDWVLVLFGKKDPELEKRGVVFIEYLPRIAYLANIAKANIGLNPLVITPKTLISSQNRTYEYAKLGVRVISSQTALLEENFEDKMI
ncbi:MAG: glycosyltransferase, partial [Candidatus Heimdallarchaeota archaeon]